jgi:hypothetical protein
MKLGMFLTCCILFNELIYFGAVLGLELRASYLPAGTLWLEPLYQPCYVLGTF